MTRGLALVVIRNVGDKYRYTRFLGREKTHTFEYELPLNHYWVEVIRNEPQQFDDSPYAPEAA